MVCRLREGYVLCYGRTTAGLPVGEILSRAVCLDCLDLCSVEARFIRIVLRAGSTPAHIASISMRQCSGIDGVPRVDDKHAPLVQPLRSDIVPGLRGQAKSPKI
jgi:hypothetical protein